MKRLVALTLSIAAGGAAVPSAAQSFPSKPFAPGGGVDVLSRQVAPKLA